MSFSSPSLGAWVRVLPAALIFLPACLTVAPPPLNVLWKLSIPLKEGGHFLVLPVLALGLWILFKSGPGSRVGGLLFILSALLLASPLIRAHIVARHVERALSSHGGKAGERSLRPAALSVRDLLLGIRYPKAQVETLVYARHEPASRHPGALKLDFYRPVQGNAAPCVVVVHGGGWDGGNRKQMPELNHYLASRGYAVASLDYRRAPEFRYPAPVEDVGQALSYLRTHAGELGIDSTRLVLLGRSAGGQIALQAAYTLKDPGLRAVVSYYAPADMVFGYGLPVNPLIMDSRLLMENYLGGSYSAVPAAYHGSSPVESAAPARIPTLLLHGRPDVLVAFEHTRRLDSILSKEGVTRFTVDLPWAAHGYDYMFSGPGNQISLYALERFLADETL